MKKINWEKLRKVVKNTDKTILTKAIQVDGHTIYKPSKFIEAGLDQTVVDAFTQKLNSGNHPKEIISDANGPMDSCTGVYGLNLLEFIAGVFDVSSWKIGRGSRACHLIEQLMEKFK